MDCVTLARFVLLLTAGSLALAATVFLADVGGEWLDKQLARLLERIRRAKRAAQYQTVARRHKRMVRSR